MINGWIVVREQKNVDPKYWVCLDKDDALEIAADVAGYWIKNYDLSENDLDENLYGDYIYQCSADELFSVYVQKQDIRESGETSE